MLDELPHIHLGYVSYLVTPKPVIKNILVALVLEEKYWSFDSEECSGVKTRLLEVRISQSTSHGSHVCCRSVLPSADLLYGGLHFQAVLILRDGHVITELAGPANRPAAAQRIKGVCPEDLPHPEQCR